MRRTRGVAAVLVAGALALAACGDDDTAAGGGGGGDRLTVVASFYPVAEAAERVGGDRVEVTNLTPAGVEPHDLELSTDQVDAIEDADLLLYIGEGFQPAVAERAGQRDGASVDLLDGVAVAVGAVEAREAEEEAGGGHGDEEGEEGEGEGHSEVDPHFWLDPRLLADAAAEVEAALAEAGPDDADAFAANAEEYAATLAEMDGEMESGLAGCERDTIVTSHAAFHYLAERYGLRQLPIAGLSPEVEPDADRIAELADRVEAGGVTTIFYEDLVSPEVAETLARETGVDTALLSPLEGLTEEQEEAGADYVSVMRDNLAALTAALGCPA